MPQWEVRINGAAVTDPLNLRDIDVEINRDPDTDGILIETNSDFVFGSKNSGAYGTLRTIYDADYCDDVTIEVDYSGSDTGGLTTVYEGIIYMPDVKWNLFRGQCNMTAEDNSFTAKIRNNRDIPAHIGVGRSKNDVTYTGATTQVVDLFRPSNGVYVASIANIEMYTVEEAFEDIIHFMTDDTVDFLNSSSVPAGLCIGKLEAFNNSGLTGFKPGVSFDQLFEMIKGKYNVSFFIDTSGATPVFTLIDLPDGFDTTSSVSITNIREVKETILSNKLFQVVRVGSENTQKAEGGTYSMPNIRYLSHKEEFYQVGITCNEEATLNLVTSQATIDSNVFERIIEGVIGGSPVDEFDDDLFLCMTDLPVTAQATQSDIINQGTGNDFLYNFVLTNQQVIPRFENVIPANLLFFLGDGDDGFEATKTVNTPDTAPITTFARVDYNNEISDPNGNYDNAAGQYHYTAPFDGSYRFQASLIIDNLVTVFPDAIGLDIDIVFQRRPTGGGAPIEIKTVSFNITTSQTVTATPLAFYMDANDEMNIQATLTDDGPGPGTTSYDVSGGTFETIEVETGGGNYATFDPDNALVQKFEFEGELKTSEFNAILAAPTEAITVTLPDNTTKIMWPNKLIYNVHSGATSFECVTRRDI